METKIKLLMTFKDSEGKRVSLTVDSPKADLLEAEIHDVMNLIVEKNIFYPGGNALETLVEAKVIETNTTAHDLVI